MKSVFDLLNSTVVDFKKVREARDVMEFAKNVVDEFFLSLPGEVSSFPPDTQVFLIGSWEDLMTGDEYDVGAYSRQTGRSGKEILSVSFDVSVTPERAAAALMFNEDEMRVALIMVLINLRHLDVEGSSPEVERNVDASISRVGKCSISR